MKALLEFGNRYARQSSWKDYALVKFCLFAMGLAAGTKVTDRVKEKTRIVSAVVFVLTYIPLMAKVFKVATHKEEL